MILAISESHKITDTAFRMIIIYSTWFKLKTCYSLEFEYLGPLGFTLVTRHYVTTAVITQAV